MTHKKLSVAFTINNDYVNPLKVVIYSLLKHTRSDVVYDVYLLSYRFLPENVLALQEVVKNWDKSGLSEFIYLALSEDDYNQIPDLNNAQVGIRAGWNKDVVLRLYLDKYLPTNLDKVLYLDADILIEDDLSHLFSIDLTNKAIAGVLDTIVFDVYTPLNMHNYRLAKLEGLSDDEYMSCFANHDYVNSGVLLLNIEHWRKHALGEQVLELLKLIYKKGQNYFPLPEKSFLSVNHTLYWPYDLFPDQDTINYLLLRRNLGEIIYLPINYNISTSRFPKHANFIEREWSSIDWLTFLHVNMKVTHLNLIDKIPKIWHFIGRDKPWLEESHAFARIYQKYAINVGWNSLEKLEQERLEQERLEQERLEQERLEQERLEKLEQERLEKLEQERLEKLEQERLEKLEQERLEQEAKRLKNRSKKIIKMLLPYGLIRFIQIQKNKKRK